MAYIENGVLLRIEDEDIENGKYVVPEGVVEIGKHAFSWQDNLIEVDVTSMVKLISECAFAWSPNLKKVSIGKNVKEIPDYAFFACPSLEKVEIPESVEDIGRGAFQKCINLSDIELPNSLKRIQFQAFNSCINLKTINIPEGVCIESEAFSGCTNLKTATLPQSLKELKFYVFSDCENLIEVYFSSDIEKINWDAFYGCYNLTRVNGYRFYGNDWESTSERLYQVNIETSSGDYSRTYTDTDPDDCKTSIINKFFVTNKEEVVAKEKIIKCGLEKMEQMANGDCCSKKDFIENVKLGGDEEINKVLKDTYFEKLAKENVETKTEEIEK